MVTATILLALAGCSMPGAAGPTVPLPTSPTPGIVAGPEPIIVAADGTGDVTTIAAGVAQAQDGDTVLVRPGTYREQVVIDKDIELRGHGPPQVVVEFGATSPTVQLRDGEALPNALRIEGVDATVAFIDIRGPARGIAVEVAGGSPTFDNVSVDLGGDATGPDRYAFHVTDASTASIRYSSLDGGMIIDGAASPLSSRSAWKAPWSSRAWEPIHWSRTARSMTFASLTMPSPRSPAAGSTGRSRSSTPARP